MITPMSTQNFTKVSAESEYKYNAPHYFKVESNNDDLLCVVHFQEGPVKEVGVNGIFNEDLINMIIRRLECFQNSEFACYENQMALDKLYESLFWLRKRTMDRQARGVQGTYQK